MRVASRSAFDNKPQQESTKSMLWEALVMLAFISLLLGTFLWLGGLLAVDQQIVKRSISWWAWVRFGALFHLVKSLIPMGRTPR
jgi:hypothetical protein